MQVPPSLSPADDPQSAILSRSQISSSKTWVLLTVHSHPAQPISLSPIFEDLTFSLGLCHFLRATRTLYGLARMGEVWIYVRRRETGRVERVGLEERFWRRIRQGDWIWIGDRRLGAQEGVFQ